MTFVGHGRLFRGEKAVGPVPLLALGRYDPHGIMLFHCDARWNVRGASGPYESLRDAKRGADRFYHKLSTAWVRTGYTLRHANRYWDRMGLNLRCSMCRKPPVEVNQMIELRKKKIVLCDGCIRKLYQLLSPNTSSTV